MAGSARGAGPAHRAGSSRGPAARSTASAVLGFGGETGPVDPAVVAGGADRRPARSRRRRPRSAPLGGRVGARRCSRPRTAWPCLRAASVPGVSGARRVLERLPSREAGRAGRAHRSAWSAAGRRRGRGAGPPGVRRPRRGQGPRGAARSRAGAVSSAPLPGDPRRRGAGRASGPPRRCHERRTRGPRRAGPGPSRAQRRGAVSRAPSPASCAASRGPSARRPCWPSWTGCSATSTAPGRSSRSCARRASPTCWSTGPSAVYLDRGDGLELTGVTFDDDAEVRRLAQRLAASGGRRLDDASPYVDVRLADGTRFHAVLAPVARPGTTLSLRIPRPVAFSLDELRSGTR